METIGHEGISSARASSPTRGVGLGLGLGLGIYSVVQRLLAWQGRFAPRDNLPGLRFRTGASAQKATSSNQQY